MLSCLGFVSLLWTEMHRHPDREGVPGASGRGEGHVQLPGLNAAAAAAAAGSPRFYFYLFSSFFILCLSNKVRIPLSGGHVVSVTM